MTSAEKHGRIPLLPLVVALFAAIWTPSGLQATQSDGWQAGAAAVRITPTGPVRMGGFGFRTHASEGVRHEIYAKALAFRHGDGQPRVLLTAELVDIRRDVWDRVAERCARELGVARDRLVLNESHSHSAPLVRLQPPGNMILDENDEAAVRQYSLWFIEQAVAAARQAVTNLGPAQLHYGLGLAGIAVNRRRSPSFAGLPGGPVDHDVSVLRVLDPAGKLIAVVTGYACHPSSLTDYQISGDWPGYAMAELEQTHPGAVALFVQGCGGDTYAYPRKTVELAKLHGHRLAAAVDSVLAAKMTPLSGPMRTAYQLVDLPFATPPDRAELLRRQKDVNPQVARHASRLLAILARGETLEDHYPEPVQVWRFGPELTFVALGGEVVVDYARRLKNEHGWDHLWVAGYSNDTFAYIPSARVLAEGGYEGTGSMLSTNLPGPFAPTVEEIIVGQVDALIRQTAR